MQGDSRLEIAWLRVELEALVKPGEEKYLISLGGKCYISDLTMDLTLLVIDMSSSEGKKAEKF